MTPSMQTGASCTGIEVRVLTDDGRCPLARVSFAPGEVVGPISVGRNGEWSIDAPGVAPMALELHFDGEALHVAAIAPGVRLAGRPLGRDWTRVALPGDIRFGTARIVVLKGTDPAGKRPLPLRGERAPTPVPPPETRRSAKGPRSQMPSLGTMMEDELRGSASVKNGFDDEEVMTTVAPRPLSETGATPICDLQALRDHASRTHGEASHEEQEEKTTITMRPDFDGAPHDDAPFKDERTAVGPRPVLPASVVVSADPSLARDYDVHTAVGPRPVLPASLPGSLAAAFHASPAPITTTPPATRREGARAVVAPAPMGLAPEGAAPTRNAGTSDSTAPTASDSRQAPTVVLKNRKLRGRVLTLAFRGALALAAVVLVVDLASGSRNTAPAAAIAASASATSLTPATNATNGSSAARTSAQAAARVAPRAPIASAPGVRATPIANAAPVGAPHATLAAAIAAAPATSSAAVVSPTTTALPPASSVAAVAPAAKNVKDAKGAAARSSAPVAASGVAANAHGDKSLEARAVEAAAAGAFRDAAAMYGTLARAEPTVPAYAEAARILAERSAGGARSTAF